MTKTLQIGDATYRINPDNLAVLTLVTAIDPLVLERREEVEDYGLFFGGLFLNRILQDLSDDFVLILNDFFPDFVENCLFKGRPLPGQSSEMGKWRLREGGQEVIAALIAEMVGADVQIGSLDGSAVKALEETPSESEPEVAVVPDRPAPKGFAPAQAVTAPNKKPLLSKVTSPIKPPVEPKPNITDIQALLQGQLPEGTTLDPDLLSRLLVNQANADSLEEITG